MKVIDQIERIAKLFLLVASAASAIAVVTLNASDAGDVQRFAIYVVSQAFLDLVFLFGVGLLIWMAVRSKGLRAMLNRRPDLLVSANGGFLLRNTVTAVMCLGLAVALVLNGFFMVRARAYFWRFLLQESYVEGTLQRVDALGHAGRIQDAHNLASRAQRVLTGEADRGKIGNRAFDLTVRVENSRRLSQRYRRPDPLSWNPITERSYYFGNVEALRLNPQNYEAAEILANLHSRLVTGMAADEAGLCESGSLFQTVSVLESDVFRSRAHVDCGAESRVFLSGIWQPEAVGAVLAHSREMAREFR